VKADNPYRILREVSGKSGKGLKDLALTLESLSGSDDLRPAEQVNHIYEYYLPILKTQYDDYPKRTRDLDHLHTIAEGYPELDELLADLALEPPDGSALRTETMSGWCSPRSTRQKGWSGNVCSSFG
jgi:DNA helicase-2/ATP-dependent DNA helicase PcrA